MMENIDPASLKELSQYISRTLDCRGYSAEIVKFRKVLYEYLAKRCLQTVKHLNSDFKIVGSRGEGGSKFLKSDADRLLFFHDAV